jgi:RHS repeat-associated protein
MLVTNDAGQQQETLAYYPYGQQWLDQGPANVPYKFTGQEYDSSTGLYFYKARYYDAHLGRFIQPDTIVPDPYLPQSWNRYAYVLNNPLKYTDPTGHAEALTDLGLYFASVQGFDYGGYNYVFSALAPLAGTSIGSGTSTAASAQYGGMSLVYEGGLPSFGYNGTFGGFVDSGVEEIARDLQRGGQQVERLNSGQIERGISLAEQAYQVGLAINAIGHSFGGDAVVDLSRALDDRGISVNVLVTIDSVGFDNTRIPKNVSVNLNFYQEGLPLPRPFCICGAENVAVDPSRTLVINVPRPEGHLGIPGSLEVQGLIKQFILGRQ